MNGLSYAERKIIRDNELLQTGLRIGIQFAMDTLQMTIHDTEGWGYDRICRLTQAWMETQREYRPALNSKEEKCLEKRVHMERMMDEICEKHMETRLPFEKRYDELNAVKVR